MERCRSCLCVESFLQLGFCSGFECSCSKAKMTIDGKLEKMEVDYSETVDRTIPECEQIAAVSHTE